MGEIARKALIIFAKEPVLGKVKTRLAQDICKNNKIFSLDQAYQKSMEAFKLFCVQIAQRDYPDIDIHVFYASEKNPDFLKSIWPHTPFVEQAQGDLGDKMHHAFLNIQKLNYDYALCIGTDSPDLPQEYIYQGFHLLKNNSVVLGPTEDGGYYTIGMNLKEFGNVSQHCFHSIPWSTSRVFQITSDRLVQQGFPVGVLPQWYDIDELAELRRFMLSNNKQEDKYFETFEN